MPFRDTIRLWGGAAWGHQYDEAAPGVSGSVPILATGFNLAGAPVNEDWGEFELGASGRISENVRLNISAQTLFDDMDDLGYAGMIGLSIMR